MSLRRFHSRSHARHLSVSASALTALALGCLGACGDDETSTHTPFNQLVAATECRSCAVEAGKLYCWGKLDPDPAPPSSPKLMVMPKPVVGLAMSRDHACALLDEIGGVYCWGENDAGQLGVTAPTDNPMVPVATAQKSQFSPETKQLVLGEGFTCALAGGEVKCAGGRIDGTLGNGPDVKSDIPLGVPKLGDIVAIAGGNDFACALDAAGVVSCWGKNDGGQCAQMDNDTVLFPQPVAVPPADKIWAGTETACVHTTAGEIYCWGDNGAGLFGKVDPGGPTPVSVPLTKYADMVLGSTRGCGMDASGNVDCWGNELVKNPMKNDLPTAVPSLVKPNAWAAGFNHDCAWDGGYVYCWGQNSCGQVGAIGPVVAEPTQIVLHGDAGAGGAASTTNAASSSSGQ